MGLSFPPAGFQHPAASPLAIFMGALTLGAQGQHPCGDAAITVIGDSTGQGDDRWPYRLASLLAAAAPNACVLYHEWDLAGSLTTDIAGDYGAARVLQAGASGQRCLTFVQGTDTGTRTLTQAEVGLWTPGGPLQLEWEGAPVTWQRGAESVLICLFVTAGSNKSFRWYINSANQLAFDWSSDGNSFTGVTSSAALTFTAGQRVRLRMQFTPSTGVWLMSYSLDSGATWTNISAGTYGATSINQTTTANYEIGGRGLTTSLFGKIYDVQIRDGLSTGANGGARIMNPVGVTAWQPQNNGTPCGSVGGSTTLHFYNGSRAGENLSQYFSDAVRFPKLVRAHHGSIVLLNTGHNEAGNPGAYSLNKELLTPLAAWVAQVKARVPGAAIGMVTQNPRIAPDVKGPLHAQRMVQMAMGGFQLGMFVIDTFHAYLRQGDWGANPTRYINPDIPSGGLGVHPTSFGSDFQARTILAAALDRVGG